MNPYTKWVDEFVRLLQAGKHLLLGQRSPARRSVTADGAPKVLIFSPHPDDECIIGGAALRLMRQAGMRVSNVAVTQGSRKDRQEGRYRELQAACDFLGWGLLQTAPDGLERISAKTRQQVWLIGTNVWKWSQGCCAGNSGRSFFCPMNRTETALISAPIIWLWTH